MKNSLITFLFLFFILILTGCQSNDIEVVNAVDNNLAEEAPAQERPSSENGVTLTAEKELYTTSVEQIVVEFKNDSTTE